MLEGGVGEKVEKNYEKENSNNQIITILIFSYQFLKD